MKTREQVKQWCTVEGIPECDECHNTGLIETWCKELQWIEYEVCDCPAGIEYARIEREELGTWEAG